MEMKRSSLLVWNYKDGEELQSVHLNASLFQVVEPDNNVKQQLMKNESVDSIEDEELWVDGDIKKCTEFILNLQTICTNLKNG